jgi:prepilin-type N-terminal cleavage/methylation domain-containing protein
MLMNLKTNLNSNRFGQHGFTLIELLIAMLIGLIILSAVLGMFVSMIKADTDNIKAIQLNQELRGVMSLITRDLRRAGANRNAAVDATDGTPSNPFSVAGGTRLAIAANAQANANSCVTYTYDEANSGVVDAGENFGFRWDSAMNAVETRAAGAACGAVGWTNVTDPTLVSVTGLTFTDTTVVEAGINIRQITVILSGQLVRDATVTRTITETVKLRNDEF